MSSNAATSRLPGSENWELPSFNVAVSARRSHSYALVIPVINEGERIRSQLLRIRDAKLPVDVIVADGGSTDGSLDSDFVVTAGVRAILTKTGAGQLSAQLRMAYAWCLHEGYQGIVTIDGNGKDEVDAVADMVTKLQDGCDYVQGSRYLPGGLAENTPLERTIANRGIHAPLLSLAGRHWFTDTTNGFRAYSARYLLDPRVQPFREIFQRYELLFYLTVRAGQLDMKVAQAPVIRRYPQEGGVPTKITGLKSKLAVLKETISAATGGYTPDIAKPMNSGWRWLISITLLVTLPIFLASIVSPNFSPDSWAYYELGQTIFTDFYRFSHFRTYWDTSPYSSSFPPLFPIIIAAFDNFLNTGARSGFYVAFIGFLAFALASEKIGRRVFGVAWLGLGIALLQLLGPGMLLDEMTAGRTLSLQLFFFSIIFLFLIDVNRLGTVGAIAIGVLSGLAVLNRFDAILLPLVSGIAVWFFTRSLVSTLVTLLSAAVAISPWIIYSLITFGVPFVTDNATVAQAIDPAAFVTDWWPVSQQTIADNPVAWLNRIFNNSIELTKYLSYAGLNRMGLVFLMSLLIILILLHINNVKFFNKKLFFNISNQQSHLFAFFILLLTMLAPQIASGYYDSRYFIPIYWVGFMLLSGIIVSQARNAHQRQVFAKIFFIFILVSVFSFSMIYVARSVSSGNLEIDRWKNFEKPPEVFGLSGCLKNKTTGRILVLGNDTYAARIGALTGLHTMLEPRNMLEGRLDAEGSRAFLATWHVRYVLVASPQRLEFAERIFNLERVPNCRLTLFKVLS